MPQLTDRTLEELEILAGIRRQNVGRAAVRLDDLNGLLQIPETLKSVKVSGTPTDAEFNALVDDVVMLHTRLRAIVMALRSRLGRR